MNISLQNVDKVSAVLTAQIEKADYQEKVEKALKTLRQRVNMPGFRKGMVPMGLIKKQYGTSVLLEEVDKLLQEKVGEYIRENKVNMLGTPLPKENNINFETDENFEFSFDIALAPEFNVELSAADNLDYYDINVTDEMVDQQVKMYTQRTAKYEKVEDYQDNDMLKGLLAELDENGNTKEGGLQVEGAVMMPSYMKNDDQKAIFNGAKVNTVLVFNPSVAFDNNEAELASLLKVKKEDVAAHTGNFSFQIEEITRMIPGELTQELFDQVLGEGKAHSDRFLRAAADDLNLPKALASVWALLKDETVSPSGKLAALYSMDGILGLGLKDLSEAPAAPRSVSAEESARIEELLARRREAKAARDFARADEIRDRLAAEGIRIRDTAETTLWEKTGGGM